LLALTLLSFTTITFINPHINLQHITMSYPSEKRDSFTDSAYAQEKADINVSSIPNSGSLPPSYSPIDTTQPQGYDMRDTKTDWIFKGAFSLRLNRDDPSTEAWNCRISSKALEIYRADGTMVGTAGLHSWSSKIDVAMHKNSIPEFQVQKKGYVCMLASRVFEVKGQNFTWKSASKLGMKFKLVNEAGEQVAWVGPTSWKGRYRFELNKAGLDVDTVEAILVTALAINENAKRETWAASSAASSSAAASVAVS